MLRPWPCTGLPIVVPDSVVLGRLSKPSVVQPSNPWTVTGSAPFLSLFPNLRVRAWVACFCCGCRKSPRASAQSERAIRSSPGFLGDPRASFSFRRRGCLLSPSSARLGRWASASLQGERSSLHTEREGDQEFPWLFMRPSRILFVWKGGFVCRAPSSASLGRWVSARLQEEPPSLCTEREGDQEFPWLFV